MMAPPGQCASNTILKQINRFSFSRLNNCDIENLAQWVYRIRNCCPSIKYLSLMGNPGATSTLTGGTVVEHNDYRCVHGCIILFISSFLKCLIFPDILLSVFCTISIIWMTHTSQRHRNYMHALIAVCTV